MNKNNLKLVSVYGLAHFLTDFLTVITLFAAKTVHHLSPGDFFYFIILYNLLAFATQWIFGLIIDRYRIYKSTTILGLSMAILGLIIMPIQPLTAIIIGGIGNSLFHVAGGGAILNLQPGKATLPGIFVGPGAIGLLMGIMYASQYSNLFWPLILASLLIICILYLFQLPPSEKILPNPSQPKTIILSIIILILIVITIRSYIGLILPLPWKSVQILLITLTTAIFIGKALGGIIADKYGWAPTITISLLISAILLPFATSNPIIGILGLFIFQFSMAITVTSLHLVFPSQPSFAFGLTCLALFIGNALTYLPKLQFLSQPIWISIIILIASLAAFFGVKPLIHSRITKNISL